MAEDVVDSSSESHVDDPDASTEEDPQSDTPSETGEEDRSAEEESSTIPIRRFKQINEKLKSASNALKFYEQNFGSREDIAAFLKWREESSVDGRKEKPESGKRLTEEQKEAVRQLVRESDPELKTLIDEIKADKENAEEAMFDHAVITVRRLAADAGLPKDDKWLTRFGQSIMLEIKDDRSLMQRWMARDMSVVSDTFDRLKKEYIGAIQRTATGQKLADKRNLKVLPKVAAGGSATISQKKDDLKGKGLTKDVHDRAWQYLKEISEE